MLGMKMECFCFGNRRIFVKPCTSIQTPTLQVSTQQLAVATIAALTLHMYHTTPFTSHLSKQYYCLLICSARGRKTMNTSAMSFYCHRYLTMTMGTKANPFISLPKLKPRQPTTPFPSQLSMSQEGSVVCIHRSHTFYMGHAPEAQPRHQ